MVTLADSANPRQGYPPDPLPPVLLGGSVNILAGAPGAGKSAFFAQMAVALREGQPFYGRQPAPIPFQGVISADRSWVQSTSKWFEAIGWPDIPAYSLQDDDKFAISSLRKRENRITIFLHCLDRLAPPWGGLVYVDPIALFLGGNLNDYDACMVACMEIRRLAKTRGVTILGLAHAGKQRNDPNSRYARLQDRILGSAALFGYTDTQLYLAEPSELSGTPYYMFLWHPHHAPAEDFKLVRDAWGFFTPYRETGSLATLARVLDAVPAPPASVSPRALAHQLDLSKSYLYRLLEELVAQQQVVLVKRGEYARTTIQRSPREGQLLIN